MSLIVGAYPVKHAQAWCAEVHRRLPHVHGAMWAVGLWRDGEMRGVAMVGRPARMLDVPARERIKNLDVLRVAVTEGTPNGCSMLYGACSKAARAMGADGLVTYIHLDEPGTTLRAAGWIEDGVTSGGEHDRKARRRKPALDPRPKRRFWAPWSRAIVELRAAVDGGGR